MDESMRVRIHEASLARQLDWIRAADSKLVGVLALGTALAGVLAGLVPFVHNWLLFQMLSLCGAALLLGVTFIMIGIAAFPRTRGPQGSLLYFGGIATLSRIDFAGAARSMSLSSYLDDLLAQVHRNAEIAAVKYKWIQRAKITLLACVLPWICAVIAMADEIQVTK